MKIPFEKEFKFLEREDYANYLFVFACWEAYTIVPQKWGFDNGKFLGAEYLNGPCNLYYLKDSYDKANKKHFDFLFNKPEIWDNLHKTHISNTKKLFKISNEIRKNNFSSLTNSELFKLIKEFQDGQTAVHTPRGPMWLLETPNNIVTNYLYNYLEEKIVDKKNKLITPNDAFLILTTPLKKSILMKEKEELAKIAFLKNKHIKEKKFEKHVKKYEWLEYGLRGKTLAENDFKNELNLIIKKGAADVLKKFENEIFVLKRKQKKIFTDLKIHKVHRKIFKIVQESSYARIFSKFSQYYGYYSIEGLLKEIGARANLTLEQVRFFGPVDYYNVLIKRKDYSKIIKERIKRSVHFSDKGETIYFSGKKAEAVMKKLKIFKDKKVLSGNEEIKGQIAYKGKASGRVKIINTRQEMAKMHQGNILVSHMTNPDIVPVMKVAAAIVTDLGGITCHAAIVARELKKPCIIGTKVATQILKDGDLVEVDAEKGIIRKLK